MAVDEVEIVFPDPPDEPPRRRPPTLAVLAVVAALVEPATGLVDGQMVTAYRRSRATPAARARAA